LRSNIVNMQKVTKRLSLSIQSGSRCRSFMPYFVPFAFTQIDLCRFLNGEEQRSCCKNHSPPRQCQCNGTMSLSTLYHFHTFAIYSSTTFNHLRKGNQFTRVWRDSCKRASANSQPTLALRNQQLWVRLSRKKIVLTLYRWLHLQVALRGADVMRR